MYQQSSIISAACDLVGWNTSTNAGYTGLTGYLKAAESGYYIDDLPGLSLEVADVARNERSLDDYLKAVNRAASIQVVDSFVKKIKKDLNSKELLGHLTIFQNKVDRDTTITRNNRFVGYVITPRESKSIRTTISQIGFYSSTNQTFTVYLFDSSRETAIQSKQVTVVGNQLTWTDLGWDVEFDELSRGAGERYLLGYFESELAGDLYDTDWTYGGHQSQKVFSKYCGIAPVRFQNATLDGTDSPDYYYLDGAVSCRMSGFNFRVRSRCDITDVLVDEIDMFAEAIQHHVAVRILKDALSNPNIDNIKGSGQNRQEWRELIAEYNGKLHGGITEAGQYVAGIIDKLSLDLSSIDAVCLKAEQNRLTGVKW